MIIFVSCPDDVKSDVVNFFSQIKEYSIKELDIKKFIEDKEYDNINDIIIFNNDYVNYLQDIVLNLKEFKGVYFINKKDESDEYKDFAKYEHDNSHLLLTVYYSMLFSKNMINELLCFLKVSEKDNISILEKDNLIVNDDRILITSKANV